MNYEKSEKCIHLQTIDRIKQLNVRMRLYARKIPERIGIMTKWEIWIC